MEEKKSAMVELLEMLLDEARRGELKAVTAIVADESGKIREYVAKK